MKLLNIEDIVAIHEAVINPNELQGFAGDKSLEAVIGRIENRIDYGMIEDVFDLAATYAVIISVGHVFNDANKRTAFTAMDVCLRENNVTLKYETASIGDMVVRDAQGLVDEIEFAKYLRKLNNSN